QSYLWPKSTTTPIRDVKAKSFLVTHPYHPLHERQFDLVNYTFCWGDVRVYFYDEQNRLRSMPASWTSVGVIDPFVQVSAGRSPFRVEDLLELSRLICEIKV
ncbi:DUF5372 family protein, partial [Thermodesulfobacteriota bacterium]